MKTYVSVKASNESNRQRKITAAVDISTIHPALGELESEAYNAGYDIIAQGDSLENVSIEMIAMENTEIMPTVTVWLDTSEMNSTGIVYYDCRVKFPTIDSTNLQFSDSAEYIVDKFKQVAKFVTWSQKYPIVLDRWEDDYEG